MWRRIVIVIIVFVVVVVVGSVALTMIQNEWNHCHQHNPRSCPLPPKYPTFLQKICYNDSWSGNDKIKPAGPIPNQYDPIWSQITWPLTLTLTLFCLSQCIHFLSECPLFSFRLPTFFSQHSNLQCPCLCCQSCGNVDWFFVDSGRKVDRGFDCAVQQSTYVMMAFHCNDGITLQ